MLDKKDMKRRVLDFSDCSYVGEVYKILKKELELPQWCGENLDALWDAVTGMMYTPAEVIICKTAGSKDAQELVDAVISLLQEAQNEYNEISVVVDGQPEINNDISDYLI